MHCPLAGIVTLRTTPRSTQKLEGYWWFIGKGEHAKLKNGSWCMGIKPRASTPSLTQFIVFEHLGFCMSPNDHWPVAKR